MTQIYAEDGAIEDRLAQLGLEEDRLTEIVRRGYVAFASCTPNDPPLYPGFSAWAAMVRGLREYLLPAWSRCDENNYSLVVNPSDTMAIAVATGDDATGRIDVSPTTKSSKGPSTADAVSSNQLQLELPYIFDSAPATADDGAPEEKRITWIFLVHRARDEVRCELSLPTSMGTDGRVDKWRERIILKAFPTDPEVIEIRPPQPLPDISVDVKRRA